MKVIEQGDILKYFEIIHKLLKVSYKSNFNISEDLCNNIVELKIHELGEYVKSKKAILIGSFFESSLIGFVWLYVHDYFGETRLHVNQIIIDQNFRGQGIAKELLSETEKVAINLGVKTIDLYVSEENPSALNIYRDFGYVTERRLLKKKV